MYLLDTNVVSELRRPRPNAAVLQWMLGIPAEQLFLPAVTIGEIQAGIEITREQNSAKAEELEAWLDQVMASYGVLPMGADAFRKCLKSVLGSGSNVDMGAPKVVFHEQREISKRPERQRMAILGAVAACSQTSRPADQIPAQGGGERYSLCVAHRMRMANAPSRPASVAHHVPLLPHLAWRWDHGADT